MAKKSSRKGADAKERGGRRGQDSGRRKTITHRYKRNYTMGIGIILFTVAWAFVVSPMIADKDSRTLGYILLIGVSLVNWYIAMFALRLMPWSPGEIILGKNTVTVRTLAGKERSVIRHIKRLRMQTNPIFVLSRGLMILGETPEGKQVRESIFFGDLGKEEVYQLAEELKRYQ